jgi:xanthine/uracil permease
MTNDNDQTPKNGTRAILIALIWAAAMIAVAYFFKGRDNTPAILMLMIAGWIATGGLAGSNHPLARAERRFLCRLFGRTPKSED